MLAPNTIVSTVPKKDLVIPLFMQIMSSNMHINKSHNEKEIPLLYSDKAQN